MKRLLQLLSVVCAAAGACAAGAPVFTNASPAAPVPAGTNASPIAHGATLSASVSEVLRLAESSVDEAVILAYVEASQTPFDLSADDVIYLKDVGVSPTIVTAMLRQDAVLQGSQAGLVTRSNEPALQPPSISTNTATAPVYVTNAPPEVAYFYDPLAPYGTWVDVEGVGWCWQPRVAVIDRAWRPYWNDGRWIYTDSDWYWYSDYSWGWAPFHYGRWHLHARCGWVWAPDLVWSPAWVCWRYSDVYCGWAPLPLGARWVAGSGFYFNGVSVGVNFDFHLGIDFFTFVEIGRFHDHHPHLHGVPHARRHDVYRNTTVINNYVVGRNNRVINHGVPVGRVTVASRHEIHPVEVRDAHAGAGGRTERLDVSGKAPVLYRPQLPTPARTQQITAQRIDQRHPVIVHPPRTPSVASRDGRTTIARPAPSSPRAPATTQPQVTRPHTQTTTTRPQPTPAQPRAQSHTAPGSFPPRSVPRAESPKARDQRVSNGRGMERVTPLPPMPRQSPAGQPHGHPQSHGGQRKSGTR
jgi:hypothetical protein